MAPGIVREMLGRGGPDGSGVSAAAADDGAEKGGPWGDGAGDARVESTTRHQQLVGGARELKLSGPKNEVEVSHSDLVPDPRVVDAGRREGGIHASHRFAGRILDRGGWEDPEIAELVTRRPWRDKEGLDRDMSHREAKRHQVFGGFSPGCYWLRPGLGFSASLGDPGARHGGARDAEELTTGSGILEWIHQRRGCAYPSRFQVLNRWLGFAGRATEGRMARRVDADGAIVWNGRLPLNLINP